MGLATMFDVKFYTAPYLSAEPTKYKAFILLGCSFIFDLVTSEQQSNCLNVQRIYDDLSDGVSQSEKLAQLT